MLRADLVAGLSGEIIVVPQGVAYLTIAGLPPQYGRYAAMVPTIIAALFGPSWHLMSGPTAAISMVVFSTVRVLTEPDSADYINLVLSMTFLVGVMQPGMELARLGALVDFISHSVVFGFTAGAGLLIAASQLKNFFGVSIRLVHHFSKLSISSPCSVPTSTLPWLWWVPRQSHRGFWSGVIGPERLTRPSAF